MTEMPITTELYDYVSTTYTNVTFPLCIFTQQKSNVYVFVTPIDNYNAKAFPIIVVAVITLPLLILPLLLPHVR